MAIKIFPTQEEGFTELRAFLQSILPPGIEIVVGQANRVPMPPGKDFVVMTPLHRPRLATNVDTNSDTRLIGSISGTTLTATEVDYGKIVAGRQLFGVDVAANTTVVQQLTGTPPGGVGTYKVTPAQTVTSQLMACGVQDLVQKTEVTFQVDVYGPLSGDNAQTISTLLRDDYGFQAMLSVSTGAVATGVALATSFFSRSTLAFVSP